MEQLHNAREIQLNTIWSTWKGDEKLKTISIIYCQCHYSNRTFFAFLSIICPSLCMRRSLISLLCVWMCDCNDFVLVLFMSFLGIILYFLLPLCVITVMRAQLGQKKRNKLNSSRPSIDSFAVQLPEFSLRIARVQKQESRIENQESSRNHRPPIKTVDAELTFAITGNRIEFGLRASRGTI